MVTNVPVLLIVSPLIPARFVLTTPANIDANMMKSLHMLLLLYVEIPAQALQTVPPLVPAKYALTKPANIDVHSIISQ